MKNFNEITEKEEKEALIKFKEHGAGINMGKYAGNVNDENALTYTHLMDPSIVSEHALKRKMIEIGNKINSTVNDSMLGDTSRAFTVKTPLGKRVKFTWEDCYTFLRAVLRERRNAADYKKKIDKYKEVKAFIDENKTTEEKVAEAAEMKAALAKELGEEVLDDLMETED